MYLHAFRLKAFQKFVPIPDLILDALLGVRTLRLRDGNGRRARLRLLECYEYRPTETLLNRLYG